MFWWNQYRFYLVARNSPQGRRKMIVLSLFCHSIIFQSLIHHSYHMSWWKRSCMKEKCTKNGQIAASHYIFYCYLMYDSLQRFIETCRFVMKFITVENISRIIFRKCGTSTWNNKSSFLIIEYLPSPSFLKFSENPRHLVQNLHFLKPWTLN